MKEKTYTVKVYADGDKFWYVNGQRHREDGPACEWPNGSKEWFVNGKLHREDGPAIEYANGNKFWYVKGKRHRLDGPACEYANGNKRWYVKGKLHREDGPAIEYANGDKHWYVNGQRHREDGPACEWANGTKWWYINGVELTEKQFNERNKKSSCANKIICEESGGETRWIHKRKGADSLTDREQYIVYETIRLWLINAKEDYVPDYALVSQSLPMEAMRTIRGLVQQITQDLRGEKKV